MLHIVTAFYYIGICVYELGVLIASLFDDKARQLRRGRGATWKQLKAYDPGEGSIWFHAASLGEFEQGRPLMEAIKKRRPTQKIVLSFYSPSGYEVRKNYPFADLVCYLPSDGPANASKFIDAIKPTAAYFIKYEFWHFFLTRLRRRQVPLYGVSMIFRPSQPFFAPFGDWFRDMLRQFTHIYLQDAQSAELLEGIGLHAHTVVGDTRFDRVNQIAAHAAEVPLARQFAARDGHILVCGSTWPGDEDLIVPYINDPGVHTRLLIAPHETDEERVRHLLARFTVPAARYTELEKDPAADPASLKVLIIDTIGILSTLYRYGDMAYIGGGFGAGLHNTLEAAIYGRPVIMGPNNAKFREAQDLKAKKAGFEVHNAGELRGVLERLTTDSDTLAHASQAARLYCESMLGATERILNDTLKQ